MYDTLSKMPSDDELFSAVTSLTTLKPANAPGDWGLATTNDSYNDCMLLVALDPATKKGHPILLNKDDLLELAHRLVMMGYDLLNRSLEK